MKKIFLWIFLLQSFALLHATLVLDGNGSTMDLSLNALEIGSGQTVLLKNFILNNLQGNDNTGRIIMYDSTSSLTLQNCTLNLSGDYTYTHGYWTIRGANKINGYGKRFTVSPADFINHLRIEANASLEIGDGVKLEFDEAISDTFAIIFDSTTSSSGKLILSDATLYANIPGGLTFTNGELVIRGESTIDGDTTLTLGCGIAANDCFLTIEPSAKLHLAAGSGITWMNAGVESFDTSESGILDVKNGAAFNDPLTPIDFNHETMILDSATFDGTTSITLKNVTTLLRRDLNLNRDITLNNVILNGQDNQLTLATATKLFVDSGATVSLQNLDLVNATNKIRFNDASGKIWLDDVKLDSDIYSPFYISPYSIEFTNSDCMFNAGLTLPVNLSYVSKFPFGGTLSFNEHNLTLSSDLIMGANGRLDSTTNGTISTDADANLRSIFFNGDQSFSKSLKLNNNLILDGNKRTFDLGTTGSIDVATGKTLTLKNMTLKGSNAAWVALGAGSKLYLENVVLARDLSSTGMTDEYAIEYTNTDCVFNAGLTLQKNSSFASKSPFGGTLSFNEHKLTLSSDLIMGANGVLDSTTNGTISTDADANNREIFFNKNQTFSKILTLNNNLVIDGGNKYYLDLNLLGHINVAAGKTITLRNIILKNLHSGWLTWGDSSSTIVVDNVKILNNSYLAPGDYYHIQGTFNVISNR
ncbi:TPA: hypothetical protein DEO28_01015 [Candidatus Dependentiae bacterium]|nr:hypothetical protein [Candidatus Dependentiae bacterium]